MTLSYLNPKCEARPHPEGGCGVFALEKIQKGELISLWGGSIVRKDELDPSMPRFTQRVLQIDEGLYILTAEAPEPNDCFNHSCDPSLGFFGQIGLVAMRDIEAGEELMFDYAMSDGGPYDEVDCYGGSANARQKITGTELKLRDLWVTSPVNISPYLARRIMALREAQA